MTRRPTIVLLGFLVLALLAPTSPPARASGPATQLTSINSPSAPPSRMEQLTNINGALFFNVVSMSGTELWRSDGTVAGTKPVGTIGGVKPQLPFFEVGDRLLFFVADTYSPTNPTYALYAASADLSTAELVKGDMSVDWATPSSALGVLDGALLFVLRDTPTGASLWRSDGTVGGTAFVKQLNAAGPVYPYAPYRSGGAIYFAGADDASGVARLWRTAGSADTTVKLGDVQPLMQFGRIFAELDGDLYFPGTHPTAGAGLWRTDGSVAGTTLVKQLPYDTWGMNVRPLVAGATRLYFFVGDDSLWTSDGTGAGTLQVAGQLAFTAIDRLDLVTLGDIALFKAQRAPEYGVEPWTSDGTPQGTGRLTQINPSAGSEPYGFTRAGMLALFSASGPAAGREIWRTDGTADGTQLALDVFPGSEGSNPGDFTVVGGNVFFTTLSPVGGMPEELWVVPLSAVGGSRVYLPIVRTLPL